MTAISRAAILGMPALFLCSFASAQVEAPTFQNVPYKLDSGMVDAPVARGTDLVLVDTMTVQQPGADWLRLYFDDVLLAGDPLAGNGAQLHVIAPLDGSTQIMNAIEVERWRQSTAYFNGDTVIVEIWAAPNSGQSRVHVGAIDIGMPPLGADRSICGTFDDRLPSTDPRSGRLLPIGCTGWLIQDCAGCALTAGHCTGNINVLQFNVPPSNSNGSINNPPASDQYPVDANSIQTNGGQGVGNDYAYFGTFPNGTTGMTASQAQGPGFILSDPPAAGTATIRITGFGTDGDNPTRNQTQQTHTGPLVTATNSTVQYQTDTTGGNSGSPVIWEETGMAVGIHTHGGCSSGGGQNSGTAHSLGGLQAFLASPTGVCGGGIDIENAPTLIPRGTSVQVAMSSVGTLVAGTATLHYRASASGMFQQVAMTDMGSGMFVADLPAFDCGDAPEFFASAQDPICGQVFAPMGGASDPFEAAVGTENLVFGDDFEADMGWQSAVNGASSGQWQRGIPVNDGNWAWDPASDGDGSGRCYVTQNQNGNTDVDGGSVTLTSPATQVTSSTQNVTFLYYLNMSNNGAEDALVVEVSVDGGAWMQLRRLDQSTAPGWEQETLTSSELASAGVTAGSQLRVRFTANDSDQQSIVEAGVDSFRVGTIECDPSSVGTIYCAPAVVNSSGSAATLTGNGSDVLAMNDLVLTASDLPQSSLGYFVVSQTQGFVPQAGGSIGNLCVVGNIGRYAGNVLNSGATGTFTMPVDWTAIPQPNGSVTAMVGETWNFQAWFRDFVVFPTSNFTSGLAVTVQ